VVLEEFLKERLAQKIVDRLYKQADAALRQYWEQK